MGRQGKNRPVGKIRGAIRLGADESGQGLTELALVLPLFLRIPVLRATGIVGLVSIVIADWRTANRWRGEREG